MKNKILGLSSFALCAASQVFIRHSDTALFFAVLFFAIGAYEYVIGEIQQRKKR